MPVRFGIARRLRNIADQIEAGEYGKVEINEQVGAVPSEEPDGSIHWHMTGERRLSLVLDSLRLFVPQNGKGNNRR